jgi:hypothetical protein
MNRFRVCQYAAAIIASCGFVMPSSVFAATPTLAISDVSLGEAGTLYGQVVDGQGVPMAKATVLVRSYGREPVQAVTDAEGRFSVAGLQGGTYEVASGGGSAAFRLWTAAASPPAANRQVLIVAGDSVARGQQYQGRYMQGRRRPITNGDVVRTSLYAGGFAALITGIVIVAVDEHDQNSGS